MRWRVSIVTAGLALVSIGGVLIYQHHLTVGESAMRGSWNPDPPLATAAPVITEAAWGQRRAQSRSALASKLASMAQRPPDRAAELLLANLPGDMAAVVARIAGGKEIDARSKPLFEKVIPILRA